MGEVSLGDLGSALQRELAELWDSLWAKALQDKKNKDTDQSVIVEMVIIHSSRTQKKNAHMKKYKIPKEKKAEKGNSVRWWTHHEDVHLCHIWLPLANDPKVNGNLKGNMERQREEATIAKSMFPLETILE